MMFLVPTLICWVVWLALRIGGVDTFAWPIFPTLGTSIPLVDRVASRKEIIAGSEAQAGSPGATGDAAFPVA